MTAIRIKKISAADAVRIQNIAETISSGYGFWGHAAAGRIDLVQAFVDGLRAKGHSDVAIVFFGDFGIARHIADGMECWTGYATARKYVESYGYSVTEPSEVWRTIVGEDLTVRGRRVHVAAAYTPAEVDRVRAALESR
jgi:hypothetical protein